MSLWPKVRNELDTMVNRHFETPEYKQFFSVKLTPAREKLLDLHYPHYIKSRRDCWAAAQVKAPPRDRRRHTVPVHRPERVEMAEKPAPIAVIEAEPDLLRDRTEPVDDEAPVRPRRPEGLGARTRHNGDRRERKDRQQAQESRDQGHGEDRSHDFERQN